MIEYDGIPIRIMPWWLRVSLFVLGASRARGAAFRGTIYLRKDLFESFVGEKLDGEILAVMAHEAVHIHKAKKKGPLRWVLYYFVFKSERLQEELEAIKAEMKVLSDYGLEFNIAHRARAFSSSPYLWMTSYEKAKSVLTEMWEKTKTQ